jgi:F0F1-type ATP synthase membrane subunit c/vacuolar-type H+-ATPase subunit K
MEDFLLRLQESDFGVWVSSAPTIFAYPTILMLHTVGLAMIVGPAWVLDVRLLGYGARLPVEALRGAFRIMWIGFFINASTGIALFISEADDKGMKWIFWVKLLAIALALIVTTRLRGVVFGSGVASDVATPRARRLAKASMFLWFAAITAGRLMAYIK